MTIETTVSIPTFGDFWRRKISSDERWLSTGHPGESGNINDLVYYIFTSSNIYLLSNEKNKFILLTGS